MTTGRDEPKKRRGRGKADAIPEDELGWLAELRGPDPAKATPEQRLPRRTPGEQQPPRGDLQPPRDEQPPPRTQPPPPRAQQPQPPRAQQQPPPRAQQPLAAEAPLEQPPRRRFGRGGAPRADAVTVEPPRVDPASTGELPKARDRSTKDSPTPIPPSARSRRPAPAPAPGPPPRATPAAMPPDLRPPEAGRTVPQSPPPIEHPPRVDNPLPGAGRPGPTGPGGVPAALTRPNRPPTAPRQTAATAGTPAKAVKRGRSPERVENTWGGHDTAGGTGEFFALPPDVLPPDAVPPDGSGEFVRSGRGAKALERQRTQVSLLRAATLILVALAVVGAPAAFFVIREFSRDPVFVELDNLSLPVWAAGKHTDAATGSRWCVDECRLRQRTWQSGRNTDETEKAYVAALTKDGWTTWNIPDCQADGVDGVETCWQRDEFVLDLWVRPTVCDIKPVRPTIGPAPSPAPSVPGCQGSIATVKVFNRISYQQAATS